MVHFEDLWRNSRVVLILILIQTGCAPLLFGGGGESLDDREQIIHVLDRLGYGPRPGDVERIEKMGLKNYIKLQLHPEQIPHPELDGKLSRLPSLEMTSKDLMKDFYLEIGRFAKKQKNPGMIQGSGMASLLKEMPDRWSLRCVGEMQTAKLLRAVESPAQLEEVLVDFWSNHFNIDVKKASCRVLKVADERDVIRPHILGKFRDLLKASATSPAMMVYLDNAQNSMSRDVSPAEERLRKAFFQKLGVGDPALSEVDGKMRTGGLNENYGREILELHTLGVDGGYTQEDVVEVARCFTGWGWSPFAGTFSFQKQRHDDGTKRVLGQVISAGGGQQDGWDVLDLLASHPSTARFISTKLCRRFLDDDPPDAVVDRVTAVFQKTDGDLRQVMQAIIDDPEFFWRKHFQRKIKSPFEFAVSSVRALDGHISLQPSTDTPQSIRLVLEGTGTLGYAQEVIGKMKRKSLNWHVHDLGQPLYSYPAPTGYTDHSQQWVSSGALISRLNFALALAGRTLADVEYSLQENMLNTDLDHPEGLVDALVDRILPAGVGESTHKVLLNKASESGRARVADPMQVIALILGSPEFQRH